MKKILLQKKQSIYTFETEFDVYAEKNAICEKFDAEKAIEDAGRLFNKYSPCNLDERLKIKKQVLQIKEFAYKFAKISLVCLPIIVSIAFFIKK